MILDLIVHTEARDDIREQTAYLDDRTPDAGARFLAALEHVFNRLVTFPGLGSPFATQTWPNLRRVPLPTFPLSVFYEPSPTAIDVYRVLHHARDVLKALDQP